jgi:hypothetical protein
VHHFLDFHRNSPFEKVSSLAIWQLAEQPSEPPPPSICANGSFAFDYPARQFALILIKMPNFIHGQALSRATFYCEKIRPIFFVEKFGQRPDGCVIVRIWRSPDI